VKRKVVFSPEAQADLLGLYNYIAEQSGPERAFSYTDRIASYCSSFADFGERGTRRDDIRPGLRTIGFARRVVVAFHLTTETVTIDRILYGGRDIGKALTD
jgi:toxin ParE1/3/4